MAEPSLFSFFADAPADSPLSYQQLLIRQKLAEAAAAQSAKRPYPTNIGEGIFSAASDLSDAFALRRLDQQSRLFSANEARQRAGLGGLPTDETAPSDTSSAPAVAPPGTAANIPPPAVPDTVAPDDTVAPPPAFTPPVVAQDDAPMSPQAIAAGATQGDVNAGRSKLAQALTQRALLANTPIGGGQPAPFAPLQATERMVAQPPDAGTQSADLGTPPVMTSIPKAPAAAPLATPPVSAGTLPSGEPIPGAPPPEAIKPLPGRPPMVPYSVQQQNAFAVMNDPNKSPMLRASAKEIFDAWEKQRTARQEQVTNQYNFDRAQNAQAEKANREAILGNPTKRLAIEAAINTNRNAPLETQKLQLGNAQTAATTAKTLQEYEQNKNSFDKIEVGGQTLVRPKGALPDTPFIPAPGSPGPQLTEKQGSIVRSFERGIRASEYLGDAKELASFPNAISDYGGAIGRSVQSNVYRNKQIAADAWAEAFLRDESGALIGGQEKQDKLKTFFPQAGDGPQQIAQKAQMRAVQEKSVYDSMGNAKPHLDAIINDRLARAAPGVAENTWQFSPSTRQYRVMHNGHWENPLPGEQPPAAAQR